MKRNSLVRFLAFILFCSCSSLYAQAPQWNRLNGPEGANVFSLATLNNNLFAGTSDGMYQSSDNGTNWKNINTEFSKGLELKNIDAYYGIQLHTSGSKLYASVAGNTTAIAMTEDLGKTWKKIPLDGISTKGYFQPPIALFKGKIVVLANKYLWQSANDGQTWTLTDSMPNVTGPSPITTAPAFFNDANSGMYLYRSQQFFTIAETGKITVASLTGLPTKFYWDAEKLCKVGANLVAVIDSFDTKTQARGGTAIYRLDGTTWTKTFYFGRNQSPRRILSLGSTAIIQHQAFPNYITYKSNEQASTWTKVELDSTALKGQLLTSILAGSTEHLFATESGVFRSNEKLEQITSKSKGLASGTFKSIATDAGSLYLMSRSTLYKSVDNGANFSKLPTPKNYGLDGGDFTVINKTIYLYRPNSPMKSDTSLYMSKDDGKTWTAAGIPAGTAGKTKRVRGINPGGFFMEVDASPGIQTYFSSGDEGKTWTDISAAIPATAKNYTGNITGGKSGEFLLSYAYTIFGGSKNEEVLEAHYSSNNGNSWTKIKGIAPNGKLANRVLATFSKDTFYVLVKRILKAPDSLFSIVNGVAKLVGQQNYVPYKFHSNQFYKNSNYFIVLGFDSSSALTKPGMMRTANKGSSYAPFNNGFMSNVNFPYDHTLAFIDTSIFAITDGNGVWKYGKPSMGTGIQEARLTAQNTIYPNPSSGLITISNLKEQSVVEVYNLIGEQVYVQNGNTHTAIDLSSLSKGLYILRIQDGLQVLSHKLVLE